MKIVLKLASSAIPLMLLAACGPPNKPSDIMETSQRYSLCPKNDAARIKLYEIANSFANSQNARLTSRGEEAQQELSGMNAEDALHATGGKLIVLTIEKPEVFHFSFSNLGLREKVALTVGFSEAGAGPVSLFVEELRRFWTFKEVSGGVTDDPPCELQ